MICRVGAQGGGTMKREKPKYMQIIDAAVIVIAENGYHGSQVAKIAKQAGVADGTIYLYFKNKDDILISVFKEKMGVFIERLREIAHRPISTEEKLYELVKNHYTILQNDHHLAIVTQLELRQTRKPLRTKISDILREYLSLYDYILKEGIENGVLKGSIDIRLLRQAIFGMIDETSTSWVMTGQKHNLVSLTDEVHQLILHGLKK